MYIFKFILNSKEPEVSRWDEVNIFLNLMERPEQCPGIQEITKARRQRKQLILVFTCINTSKSSTLYMRRVYLTESQSYITIKVLTKLVICRYFFFLSFHNYLVEYLQMAVELSVYGASFLVTMPLLEYMCRRFNNWLKNWMERNWLICLAIVFVLIYIWAAFLCIGNTIKSK